MLRAKCPSVCQFVTLVDCDQIVQQKLPHNTADRCLTYPQAKADPYRSILWSGNSAEEDK